MPGETRMNNTDSRPQLQLVENIADPVEDQQALRPVLDELKDAHDAEEAFSLLLQWNRVSSRNPCTVAEGIVQKRVVIFTTQQDYRDSDHQHFQ